MHRTTIRRGLAALALAVLAGALAPAHAGAVTEPFTVRSEGCTSPSRCFAVGTIGTTEVGAVASTTDGARHWSRQRVPDEIVGLHAITCPDTSTCIAVGAARSAAAIVRTTDGGAHWVSELVPAVPGAPLSDVLSVSCSSTTTCHAVGRTTDGGGATLKSVDGGVHWRPGAPVMAGGLGAISCAAGTPDCVAVGSAASGSDFVAVATATRDSGASWNVTGQWPDIAAGSGMAWSLERVSCARGTCVAVGAGEGAGGPEPLVVASTDGGARWSIRAVPAAISRPLGVRCSGTLGTSATVTCLLVADGSVLATTDAGRSWHARALPPNVSHLRGTTCTAGACWVFGATAQLLTTDFGQTWTVRAHP